MDTSTADFQRLALLIQRILDAETLYDTEGAALLAETDAACQSLEAGDTEAARRYIARIALFMEALLQTDRLALTDGQAILQVANGILHPKPDAHD